MPLSAQQIRDLGGEETGLPLARQGASVAEVTAALVARFPGSGLAAAKIAREIVAEAQDEARDILGGPSFLPANSTFPTPTERGGLLARNRYIYTVTYDDPTTGQRVKRYGAYDSDDELSAWEIREEIITSIVLGSDRSPDKPGVGQGLNRGSVQVTLRHYLVGEE